MEWQQEWNDTGDKFDYGTAVITDANGNIYVAGAANYSDDSTFDIVILQYDYLGSLQWEESYDGTGGNDYPTKMAIDNGGYLYITGASEGTNSDLDFITLKYDFSGDLEWSARYDYDELKDIPADIVLTSGGSYIAVTGGSENADTIGTWDYTTITYDQSGDEVNISRVPAHEADLRKPRDIVKDKDNNYYITGTEHNGTDYNIKLIKLDSTLNPVWAVTYDDADEGSNTIALDQDGFVYIGGWQQEAGVRRFLLLKYDSAGALEWEETLWPDPNKKLGEITHLKVTDGEIAVLGLSTDGYNSDIVTAQYDVAGAFAWQQIWSNTGESIDLPASIEQVGQDVYVSGRTADSTGARWVTLKYSFYERDTAILYDTSGRAICAKHELIVCFDTSVVKRDAVDNTNGKEAEFGSLDYFLEQEAVDAVIAAMDSFCNTENSGGSEHTGGGCTITMLKVFKRLKTTDTVTTSRLGEQIPVPPFWSVFTLAFPEDWDITVVEDALDTLFPIVSYVDPNMIAEPHSTTPNDTLFSVQRGLNGSLGPQGEERGINIFPAWEFTTGDSFVRVGVFDTGLDWMHMDFGYDSTTGSGSQVIAGWDLYHDRNLFSAPNDTNGHGTNVAGIIGASRNDSTGVAGIAGGDYTQGKKGVSLYGLKMMYKTSPTSDTTIVMGGYVNYITDAIIEASQLLDTSPTMRYRYGLHVMNCSWGIQDSHRVFTDTNLTLFRDAIHFANRQKVTFVASRGNGEGKATKQWPAVIDTNWVLAVGATDLSGQYYSSASIGDEIDVAAPGSPIMTTTTAPNNTYRYSFPGTSASAPYVSGVAALLMSYLNSPSDIYSNLAPEDVEQILEKSATDVGTAGKDIYTGYGRLNAGAALKMVDKDSFRVAHYDTERDSSTLNILPWDQNITITIQERYRNDAGVWFKEDSYLADMYKVEMTVYHNLPSPFTGIRYSWPRHSSSNLLPIYDTSGILVPREITTIGQVNADSATLVGYAYRIKDSSGNTLAWWPFDPAVKTPQMAYTLLLEIPSVPTGTNELKAAIKASLYPNPTKSIQTLSLENLKPQEQVTIQLLDLSGRLIQPIYSGISLQTQQQFKIDLSALSDGFYLCQIRAGKETSILKVMKY